MRLFWSYYLLALIAVTVLFAMRTKCFYDLMKKGRLKHNLTTDIEKKTEIRNKTKDALADMLCCVGITLLSIFAVIDCLIEVIEGWNF